MNEPSTSRRTRAPGGEPAEGLRLETPARGRSALSDPAAGVSKAATAHGSADYNVGPNRFYTGRGTPSHGGFSATLSHGTRT
jgi:hypothetical protein